MKRGGGKVADMLERMGVLLLFAVFVLMLLIVLSSGASNYRGIAQEQKEQFETRTCLNYVVSKVRHGDRDGFVCLRDFCGVQALWIEEKIENETYYTVIYYDDGYVCELYASYPPDLDLEAGERIVPAEAFSVLQAQNGLITLSCTMGGKQDSVSVFPMSRGGTG